MVRVVRSLEDGTNVAEEMSGCMVRGEENKVMLVQHRNFETLIFLFAVWTGLRAGQKSNIHNPIKNRL